MTQEDYQTHEWKNLKFTIGGIFSNKIALSESGAIEGNPAVHAIAEFVWGQLEEKDKRITELLDNGEATAKLIVQYCATIESLRKEITLKDGIISDHAESILELRKENEELKRIKREWEEVAGPLLEYGRINSDQLGIKLGDSITDGILKFLTEYNQTKKA